MSNTPRSTKTTGEIAHAIIHELTVEAAEKYQEWRDGDETAALTDEEVDFLLAVQKLEQAGELTEARVSLFRTMTDEQILEMYREVTESNRKSVAKGEGLN